MRVLLAQRLPWLPGLVGASKFNVHLLEALGRRHHCRMLALASQSEGDWSLDELRRAARARGIAEVRSARDAAVHVQGGVEFHAAPDGRRLWNLLAAQIRDFEPDAILISEDRTFLGLATAMEEAGPGRVTYIAHSQSTLPFGPESFAPDPAKTGVLRRAAGMLVTSNYVREYVQRWSGLHADVLAIPAYGSGPFPNLGNPDKGFVTLVNPSAIKGICIFEEMARARPHVDFAAVATWATTVADCERLRRLPNVRLLPPADDIGAILMQTRVILVPSLWGEAFGRIVVEAMLRGIPVLASGCGGLVEAKLGVDYLLPIRPIERYLEQPDDKGLPIPVVPRQDIGPWLEALDRLYSSREHYREVSAASRDAALNYVADLDIHHIEAILENRAARPHPAAGAQSVNAWSDLSPERLELLAALATQDRTLDGR
jgi:glycosyltransferase involved in cell wall biosynthesis